MASSFGQQAETMAEKLDYRTCSSKQEGVGAVEIYGLQIPSSGVTGFSPLEKIWSSVRKRIAEQFGVHVTAIFSTIKVVRSGQPETVISVLVYPSCAGVEDKPEVISAYLEKFERTFEAQMGIFMDAILTFLLDEELGYVAYCEILQKGGVNEKMLDVALEAFLRAHSLKTKEDDAEKKRRKKEAKKQLERVNEYCRRAGINV